MKSAYEKAMERLEQEKGPTPSLSDAQREQLAEINRRHEAKTAETRFAYEEKLAKAASTEEYEAVKNELSEELARLNDRLEEDKEAVWRQAGASS